MSDIFKDCSQAEIMDLIERYNHIGMDRQVEVIKQARLRNLPHVDYYFPEPIYSVNASVLKFKQVLTEELYRVHTFDYDANNYIPDLSNAVVIGRLDLRFLSNKIVNSSEDTKSFLNTWDIKMKKEPTNNQVTKWGRLFKSVTNSPMTNSMELGETLLNIERIGKDLPIQYFMYTVLPTIARIYDLFVTMDVNHMDSNNRYAASVLEMDIRLYEQNLQIAEDAFHHIRGSQSRSKESLAEDWYNAELWLRHTLFHKFKPNLNEADLEHTTYAEVFIHKYLPDLRLEPIDFDKKETFNLEVVKYPNKMLDHISYDWHNGVSDFHNPGDLTLMSDKQLNEILCTYFDIDGIYKASCSDIPEGILAMYLREHHMDIPITPIYTEVGMRYVLHYKGNELLAFVVPGETCLYAIGYNQNANTPIMMQFSGKRNMQYQFKY